MTQETFGLVVKFQLLEGHDEAFDGLVAETVTMMREREPHTLAYVTHIEADKPLVRVFYELYRDSVAFDAHENSDHGRRFLAERGAHLAGPPEVWRLSAQTGLLRDLTPGVGE